MTSRLLGRWLRLLDERGDMGPDEDDGVFLCPFFLNFFLLKFCFYFPVLDFNSLKNNFFLRLSTWQRMIELVVTRMPYHHTNRKYNKNLTKRQMIYDGQT